MEKATKRDVMRFAVLGLIGIFLYFIPVSGSSVPVVLIVNFIKGILGDNLKYVVLFALALLVAIIIGARSSRMKPVPGIWAMYPPTSRSTTV
ncbi:MAG: hypothetical protein V8Q30_07570 [Acutalibacteraceae bacterium]